MVSHSPPFGDMLDQIALLQKKVALLEDSTLPSK